MEDTNKNGYVVESEDLFVNQKSIQHLECNICLEILKQPRQCKEGHMYCLECIEEHISVYPQLCPTCKCAISMDTLGRSLIIERMIKDLEVYCKYRFKNLYILEDCSKFELKRKKGYDLDKEGCKEIIRYGDIESHQSQCAFAWIRCEYKECIESCRRKDHQQHIENCIYRIVECELCKESIRFIDNDYHINEECQKNVIKCNECNIELERGKMQDHLDNDCLEYIIDCPFDSNLCKEKVKRKDANQHVKDKLVDHLILQNNHLIKKNNQLETKVEELIEKVTKIRDDHKEGHFTWTINKFSFTERYVSNTLFVGNRSFKIEFQLCKKKLPPGTSKFGMYIMDLGTGTSLEKFMNFHVDISVDGKSFSNFKMKRNYNDENKARGTHDALTDTEELRQALGQNNNKLVIKVVVNKK